MTDPGTVITDLPGNEEVHGLNPGGVAKCRFSPWHATGSQVAASHEHLGGEILSVHAWAKQSLVWHIFSVLF